MLARIYRPLGPLLLNHKPQTLKEKACMAVEAKPASKAEMLLASQWRQARDCVGFMV